MIYSFSDRSGAALVPWEDSYITQRPGIQGENTVSRPSLLLRFMWLTMDQCKQKLAGYKRVDNIFRWLSSGFHSHCSLSIRSNRNPKLERHWVSLQKPRESCKLSRGRKGKATQRLGVCHLVFRAVAELIKGAYCLEIYISYSEMFHAREAAKFDLCLLEIFHGSCALGQDVLLHVLLD